MGKEKQKGNEMESYEIEGIPSGWKLIRIGRTRTGEWIVTGNGTVVQANASMCDCGYAIVERLPEPKPVCTWPGRPGVVKLVGWICRDSDGAIWLFQNKPVPAPANAGQYWKSGPVSDAYSRRLDAMGIEDLPVFNPDLPWTEHIVEVGWEETVVVKDEWTGTTMEVAGKMCEPMDCVEIGPIISPYPNLSDGWVTQDQNGDLYWYSKKPTTQHQWDGEWLYYQNGDGGSDSKKLTRNEVVFPSSWPWDQRIVRIVGNQIVRDE